jgi:hypothetical protein
MHKMKEWMVHSRPVELAKLLQTKFDIARLVL